MVAQGQRLLSGVDVTVTEITNIVAQALPTGAVATADIQPLTKGSLFDSALPSAEAAWLTDISITASGTMRVTVQASIAGILRVVITRSATTKTLNLNENTSLVASALYTFDVPVKSGDTFNLRYSTTTGTIDFCEVQFIKGGI